MSSRIVIVDYGMGNLGSVKNALDHLGFASAVSALAEDVRQADILILPGVGAFGEAMKNLKSSGLDQELTEQVVSRKKPFLGICLGMQLVAEDSEELGLHRGLGWIPGHVTKIPAENLRLPHMGWNNLEIVETAPLFGGVDKDRNFYFVHSYRLVCEDRYVLARCHYGVPVTAAIRKENIFATQFHPEKSHENGLRLLKNFLKYAQGAGTC